MADEANFPRASATAIQLLASRSARACQRRAPRSGDRSLRRPFGLLEQAVQDYLAGRVDRAFLAVSLDTARKLVDREGAAS